MQEKPKLRAERAAILTSMSALTPQDPDGLAAYPTLFDLLTPRWKDGIQTRQPGRLSLRAEGSSWRATIDCPTEGLLCHVVCASLFQLLEVLERIVAQGKANWQPNYESQKRGRPVIDTLLQ